MTKEKAIEELRKLFHKTRITYSIPVPPDVVAAILEYDYRPMTYEERAQKKIYEDTK